MSLSYFVYYNTTGEIVTYNIVAENMLEIQEVPNGCSMLVLTGPSDFLTLSTGFYVTNNTLTPRTSMPVTLSTTSIKANGASEATITGIPTGTVATLTGVESIGPETITDGELIITSNAAGAIYVSLNNATNRAWSAVINAS